MRLYHPTGFLLLLAACGGGANEAGVAADAPPLDTLVYEIVSTGVFMMDPTHINVVGKKLVILDFESDSVGHILAAPSGERVRSFGRRGSGPGAFRGAWSVVNHPSDSAGYVYDLTLRSLRSIGDSPVSGEIKLASPATLTDVGFINDTLLVGPVQAGAHRLAFFNRGGGLVRFTGTLPTQIEGVSLQAQQQSYQSSLVLAPLRDRFALLNRFAGRGQIYSSDGELADTLKSPAPFDPRFEEKNGRMTPLPETRYGYIAGSGTDALIFALFSGRDGRGTAPVSQADIVHVFDWSGKFINGYRLGADVVSIAVDPAGTHLYAARPAPSPAILRYDLTSLGLASATRQQIPARESSK